MPLAMIGEPQVMPWEMGRLSDLDGCAKGWGTFRDGQ